jgi:sortase A
MTRNALLLWIERALVAIGLVLAAWCAFVLIEAQRTQSQPLPVRAVQTLPGEEERPAPAPAAGTLLARLESPALDLSTVVLEGSDDRTLRRGAGHIEDTPLPGERGNVGIAGHRDTVFRPLRRAKAGDELTLTTPERVYQYRVARTMIVKPEDVYVLDPTNRPTLTLVTCYPFEFIGHAPKRFIVQAELVGETPVADRAGGAERAGQAGAAGRAAEAKK